MTLASFPKHRWWIALGLMLLVAGSLWLRFDGLDWSLPYRLHPDEWKYVSGGAGVHEGNWNPKYFRNPPGFSYANALWYPLWLRFCPEVPVRESWEYPPTTDVVQTLQTRPYDLVYGARALSALFGVGVVVLTVFCGRLLHSWPAGFCAGALLMVSFVCVRESHMGTNDTASVFWVMAAFLVGLIAQRKNELWLWLLAGALGGVAVATKYNTFPVVVALLVGIALLKALSWKQKGFYIWAIGAMSVLFFLLICPFPMIDPTTFFAEIEKLRQAANAQWPGQDTTFSGWQLLGTLVLSEGWIACVMALIGSAFLIKQKQVFLFVFPVAYMLLVCFHPLFFVRFALPLLPFLTMTAAVGIVLCVDRLMVRENLKPLLITGVCLLAMIEPTTKTLRSNWLFHQTDTRIEVLGWLHERALEPAMIVGDQYVLPIPYRTGFAPWGVSVDPRFQVIDGLPREQFSLMEDAEPPVGYVGVSTFASFPGQHDDPYLDRRMALRQFAGGEDATVVFSPFVSEWNPEAAHIEDTYHPTTRLWERDQPGPAIEFFQRAEP